MVHPDRTGDAALMEKLTAMVLRADPDLHERQINALVNRPDAAAVIHLIECPTLLAVGRQDQWSPVSQHEDMLRLMPNATLEIIEDAGHFSPVEQPGAVAGLIRDWATA
jgi:pimeloyl-ACP methyl ester carboxylesterase